MCCVNVVDVVGFQRLVDNAVRQRSMEGLLCVRSSLERALKRNGIQTWQARRLCRQRNRLNVVINEVNDEQARRLIGQVNRLSGQVWEFVDGHDLFNAHSTLFCLRGLADQIIRPEPFLRYAVDRVESKTGGWQGVKEKLEESLANTGNEVRKLGEEKTREHETQMRVVAEEMCRRGGGVGACIARNNRNEVIRAKRAARRATSFASRR